MALQSVRFEHVGASVLRWSFRSVKEQLVGVTIGASTVLAAVVAANGSDLDTMALKEPGNTVVEETGGRYEEACRCTDGPRVTGNETVDGGLQMDCANAFEGGEMKRIDGKQITRGTGFDVPVCESRSGSFQQADRSVRQFDSSPRHRVFKAERPVIFGREVVAARDTSDTFEADLDVAQHQLPGYSQASVSRGV